MSLTLAACDNKPNTNFEQAMDERDAASAGDPYASLEKSVPQLRAYSRTEKLQQRDYADGQAGTFRARYDSLLEKLDEDEKVDRAAGLFKSCRAAFEAASAFEKSSGDSAEAAAPARDKALADLASCRSAAREAGKSGAPLARFASTGMVLLGVKTVAQGDAVEGVRIWRESEKLVAQDKPGFELGLKSFRGY